MAKTILADLVTRMTVESAQFKRELEKTTAKTVAWSKVQQNAANQAQYTNNKWLSRSIMHRNQLKSLVAAQ